MRKVVKILDNVFGINSFYEAEEITLTRGNTENLCFRLFIENQSPCSLGDSNLTRYIPQGSSVQVEVTFQHIDDEYVIKRVASNPYAGDTSIWCVPLLATDRLMFNSMEVKVTEDGVSSVFEVETDIATREIMSRKGIC